MYCPSEVLVGCIESLVLWGGPLLIHTCLDLDELSLKKLRTWIPKKLDSSVHLVMF